MNTHAVTPTSKRVLGQHGENTARDYLIQRGLSLHLANYHCRFGEIDLIMQERDTLVFVEVRSRKNRLQTPIESIGKQKQQRLLRSALYYLQQTQQHDALCRFDVIGITSTTQGPAIEWIQNALTLENLSW